MELLIKITGFRSRNKIDFVEINEIDIDDKYRVNGTEAKGVGLAEKQDYAVLGAGKKLLGGRLYENIFRKYRDEA